MNMLNNKSFLDLCYDVHLHSFLDDNGNYNKSLVRSTKRLKQMHGAISGDLQYRLDGIKPGLYKVISKGFGEDREERVHGRYSDKNIDITITKNIDGEFKPVAAFELKFPNRQYGKNAQNFLESLLGNTANVRSGENGILYFHIDLLMTNIPKMEKDDTEFSFDNMNEVSLNRFIKLSRDSTGLYFHSPNKELLYLMEIPGIEKTISYQEYGQYMYDNKDLFDVNNEYNEYFSNGVVINDYETFVEKVIYTILSM